MAEPIYFSLLLLVLCLIYEANGNHHIYRYTRIPSHNKISPYDSSSSASEANGAVADAAATSESEATLPFSHFKKSFSSNDSLEHNKNNGLNRHFPSRQQSNNRNFMNDHLSRLHSRINQINMPSEMFKRINSMTSRILNSPSLHRNNQNDETLGDRIKEFHNKMSSDLQNFSNLTTTKFNPPAKHLSRQSTSPSSSYEDNSQQSSVGDDSSGVMNMMPHSNPPSNYHSTVIFKSLRRCCINGNCRMLEDGEECIIDDYITNAGTKQQLNNPMPTTFRNKDSNMSDMKPKFMGPKFKPFGKISFNSLGSNMDDFQEMGKPTNMRLGPTEYSTMIPSNNLSNEMGSYMVMPQKKQRINYPHTDSINMSKNEVDKIRNQVLQKSNLYRQKYNLEPFILDDQLNNCAQDWANQMVKLQIMGHRNDNEYGENIYQGMNSKDLGIKAVDAWYNEITNFNIGDDETDLSNNTPILHMTQLLWKSSTKLGVGVSKSNNGMINVVANYDPAGNMGGLYKENVPDIKQEDIDEVRESLNSHTEPEHERTWLSSSTIPFDSEANDD